MCTTAHTQTDNVKKAPENNKMRLNNWLYSASRRGRGRSLREGGSKSSDKGGFEATLVKELREIRMSERREYKDITGERNPGRKLF